MSTTGTLANFPIMAFRIGPPPHGSFWAALAALAVSATSMAVLYFADPAYANTHTLSEHIHRPEGFQFVVALVLLVFASAVTLTRAVRGGSLAGPYTRILLALWTGGLAVAAAFPVDDVQRTLGGILHNAGSVVAFLALPVTAALVGRHYRNDPDFWRLAALVRRLAWLGLLAVAVFLVTFLGAGSQLVGVTERIALLVHLCILLVLLRWSCHQPSRHTVPTTSG